MSCNPWRWLWALPVMVLWWWITFLSEQDRIQADLKQRVDAALSQTGHGWAAVAFDGRDGVVRGKAGESAEQRAALDAARQVWGVRIVDDRTALLDEQKNYAWSVARRDNRIKLAGFVPNVATRQAIIGTARATFPGREIDDRMVLARGAPDRDMWLGGISFGMKQLVRLHDGRIDLDAGGNLQVEGEAEDFAAYRSVKTALTTGLPKGIRLKADRVSAPAVSPYTWTAGLTSSQLALSGHAPSEQARDEVLAAAKQAFPKLAIVDSMQIANGAPAEWSAIAGAALAALALLNEGKADLSDRALSFTGIAARQATAEQVARALKLRLPAAVRLADRITFIEPTLPTIAPYGTRLELADERLVASGYAPSEALRKSFLDALRQRFAKAAVVDRLQLGAGAPEDWLGCVNAGAGGLARIEKGAMALQGRNLRLTGTTSDEKVAQALAGDVRAAANRACATEVDVALTQIPEPNLTWRASRAGGQLELEGDVPDSSIKSHLVETARKLFPKEIVVDRSRVSPAPSRRWSKVAETGLVLLAKLRTGEAVLAGAELTIRGEAPDTSVATAVRQALSRDVTNAFRGRDILEVRSDAMIWAEQEARRKAAEEAKRKSQQDQRSGTGTEEQQRLQAETEARERAAEEVRRRTAAEEDARRRAEAESKARAEAEARAEKAQAQRAEAVRCQSALATAAREGSILFKTASAELERESLATLDRLVEIARSCKEVAIEIEGHTDAQGTPERNQALSERRARSVVDYLVKAGVPEGEITAIGYGQSRPVASNDNATDRARNRRIEFNVKVR